MRIEFHPDDNALESRPAVWILQGKSVVLPVFGAAAFVALFRILAACGVDWPVDIGSSVPAVLAIVGCVHLLGNGKSPTFATDIKSFLIWGAKAWLSMAGALDRLPVLWVVTRKPRHREDS